MSKDINDILGISTPTKPGVRQALVDALLTGLFSYGQGLQAQAAAPPGRGRQAGFGAALAAPQILEQQRQQQQLQRQEMALKVQQLKDAALRGDQQAVLQLRQAMGNPVAPETTPIPVMPTDFGGGGAGLQPDTRELPIQPLQYPLGGGKTLPIPITSAQEALRQAQQQMRAKAQIENEFRPDKFAASSAGIFNTTTGQVQPGTSPAPQRRLLNTPGGTIDVDHPELGFIQGTTPTKQESYTPENVMLDGKPAIVLRNSSGNYIDANTKQPVTGRITPYVAPPAPRQKGEITPTAEANLVQQLNKQWETASKDVQQLYRSNAIMDEGMKAAARGDLNAGSQAVLVTFQKFLDPTSVVRESEYARSGEGLSMANRVQGIIDRLQKGGAGVTLDELQKFADLGKQINNRLAAEGTSLLSAEKKRISAIASRYGVPPELAITGYDFATGAPTTSGGTLDDALDKAFGKKKP